MLADIKYNLTLEEITKAFQESGIEPAVKPETSTICHYEPFEVFTLYKPGFITGSFSTCFSNDKE